MATSTDITLDKKTNKSIRTSQQSGRDRHSVKLERGLINKQNIFIK